MRATTLEHGPLTTLEAAIDRDAREAIRGGHKAVCAILEEPYGPFQKRLSCSYPDHHLHADDVERVIALVQGPAVLAWFEQVYGVVSFKPTPVPATRDALKALGKLLQAEGEFVGSLHDGAADNVWEAHEVETLRGHANRMISEILGIVAGAEQAMEERRHG